MKTTFNTETLQMMNLFEKITRARVKDTFNYKDRIVFVLETGQLKKALGTNSENVPKLEKALNSKIKIMEYNPNILTFIKNLMYPLKILEMKEEDQIIIIKGPDQKTKGLMIGSKAQNLRTYEEITKKYFPNLKEIKVV